MKASAPTILYSTEKLAEQVTDYSETRSMELPRRLLEYHSEILDKQPTSNYMISTFQARAMVWFTRLIEAQKVLEIGVYLGFSSMAWSHAVGPSGSVTGLEYNAEYAAQAEVAFEKLGYKNISMHVGDALPLLSKLSPLSSALDSPISSSSSDSEDPWKSYDLIFIDAQKSGYPDYLRAILDLSAPGSPTRLLRKGGLILADNALRTGRVAEAQAEADAQAELFNGSSGNGHTNGNAKTKWVPTSEFSREDDIDKLREFNDMAKKNERLESFVLPLWDGVGCLRLID